MSNPFIRFVREFMSTIGAVKVPCFIVENAANLIGTLIATLLTAIITTYIFNRKQEINKAKARVFAYRLKMYEELTRYLNKYDRMMSLENDREYISDVLSQVQLKPQTVNWAVNSILTAPDELHSAAEEVDKLAIKGLYILDDDVLAKLLLLKIYLLNLQQYSILADGYHSAVRQRKLTEEEVKCTKELFFHNFSIIVSAEFDGYIDALKKQIEQNRIHLKERKSGKNYRKIRARQKLRNKIFKKSKLAKTLPNGIVLLGLCICDTMQLGDSEIYVELEKWEKYVEEILGSEE